MEILFVLAAMISAQEIQTFNDPFDSQSAVLAELPKSAVVQYGSPATLPFAYVMTARDRKSGHITQYLKLEIEYVTTPASPEIVNASTATYEGGAEADFEVIETTEDCLPTKPMCKRREVLSVRFPFQDATGRLLKVQFKNRTAAWRATVTIPDGLLRANMERAEKLK